MLFNFSDDHIDYIFNNFRKELCAKRIQRTVRNWLGQPFYKNGKKGLIFRKAEESWKNTINHTQ